MIENRQDQILDKILQSGVESLTDDERKFMDSHKDGNEKEVGREISLRNGELPLESDDHLFEFDMESVEDYGNEGTNVMGTLTYYGALYYGKFVFNQYKEMEYWMFEPAHDDIERDGDENIWEMEYKLDEHDHSERFEDFCQKVKDYYID